MADQFFGKYVAIEELGQGGMGVVFRGRAPDTGQAVAIKVLTSADPEGIDRFERERRLLSTFSAEDGFVSLLDSGIANGRPYLVMPLMTGGTLSAKLRSGPLDVADALALVRKLVRALRCAHEKGVIHRDLKPSNVLFDERGNPFVADLGLAKHFRRDVPGGGASRSLSATGATTGTVGYMAPEQLDDAKNVTPRADVFALGVILHECLSGSLPFEAENIFRYVRALKDKRPPSLRARGVPESVELVRAKALAVNPLERYGDAGEMERALGLAQPPRRTSRIVFAGAGAFVLVVAVAAFALRTPARTIRPPAPMAPVTTRTPSGPSPAEIGKRAIEKAKKGEQQTALSELDRALELYPRNAQLWVDRGAVRGDGGDYAGEIADDDMAIELDRNLADAWGHRGIAKGWLGDLAPALIDLSQAVKLDPTSRQRYFDRSVLRHRASDDDGALADLTRALELDPKDLRCLLNRADLRRLRSDLSGEMEDLDRATKLDPPDAMAFWSRGLARERKKDMAGALPDFERALELDPQHAGADEMRAWIKRQRGR